jgi:uncharacterized protein (TIRG00374 family)
MTTQRRAHLLRIAGLIISVLAIAIVIRSLDVAAAVRILGRANLLTLGVVLLVLVVQLLLRAARWRVLLPERPDGRPVPLLRVVPPLLVGYLGNTVLPARLGEPIRAALVARRERLDALECFGTTVTERVVDTVTLAFVAFVAAMILGADTWIIALTGVATFVGVILIALLVTVGLTRVATVAGGLLRRVRASGGTHAVSRWATSFAVGVDRGRPPRRLATVIAISCLCWAIDATIFWLAAQAIDVDVTWPTAVLIAAVTVLGTAVPSAPGFVGTFELAATTTAAALGVPSTEGLAMAIIAHVMTLVPVAIAGAIAAGLMGTGLGRLSREAEGVDTGGTALGSMSTQVARPE